MISQRSRHDRIYVLGLELVPPIIGHDWSLSTHPASPCRFLENRDPLVTCRAEHTSWGRLEPHLHNTSSATITTFQSKGVSRTPSPWLGVESCGVPTQIVWRRRISELQPLACDSLNVGPSQMLAVHGILKASPESEPNSDSLNVGPGTQ
jgi:hypothetical protein